MMVRKTLLATMIIALSLTACDEAKVVSRELTNDECSMSEIAARMQELGADHMDSLGAMNSDSMASVEQMTNQSNRYSSASARITAAMMRDDLDTACKLLDQLEADMGKGGS